MQKYFSPPSISAVILSRSSLHRGEVISLVIGILINETDGKFEMRNFSIVNDKETFIPFIKEALKRNPDLKLWVSPWSLLVWIKENKHYACQTLDTSILIAWNKMVYILTKCVVKE